MKFLMNIAPLFLFLAFGMLFSKLPIRLNDKLLNKFITYTLDILVFLMGIQIGLTPNISSKFMEVGALALFLSFSTIMGTVLLLLLVSMLFRRKSKTSKISKGYERKFKFMDFVGEPLKMVLLVFCGLLLGLLTNISLGGHGESLLLFLLYILLFLIGIQLERSKLSFKEIFLKPETILIPVGTILGTFMGGLIVSLFSRLTFGQSLALSSGFGWYTLSGVLVTELGDPILGSTAFMVDILREVMAFLLIPIFGRMGHSNLAIGTAGATSLDVTLPIIERFCGTESVPKSIASGTVLSFLVPVFIPLFFNF